MERRHFVRAGLSAGAATALAPARSVALPTRRRRAGALRLNANENPLGLAPSARRAVIDAIPDANRYPDDGHNRVVAALAERLDVPADHLVLGAGSTEILQMAVQVWGREGARFVIADPTFEDVPGYAAPWNLDVVKVPLRPDHSHDLERMAAQAARADGPAMVYICNPNNPTGTLTPCDEVDAWIERASDQVTFLIDEAYLEYAESASSYWSEMKWIASRPNVVIVRTSRRSSEWRGCDWDTESPIPTPRRVYGPLRHTAMPTIWHAWRPWRASQTRDWCLGVSRSMPARAGPSLRCSMSWSSPTFRATQTS
jgi:histidinol-phosphate aminotransferase